MKIGFDAKRATANFTGLGNYSRTLIQNLQQTYPENEYLLFTPVLKHAERYELLTAHPLTRFILPRTWVGRKLKALWRTLYIGRLAAREGVNVFHGLSGELPLFLARDIRAILTVHDLIFMRYPGYYKRIDRFFYKKKLEYACHRADEIIAISEQTKNDLIAFLQIAPDKIQVLYQACDDVFRQVAGQGRRDEIRTKYRLPPRFVLNVGTLEIRKNTMLLLQALHLLEKDTRLVLVGKRTNYTAELDRFITENDLTGRVTILDSVPFQDLPVIYQLAEIFVYPSVFEGFGIPIEEALFSGVPVISSKGSCFTEAGGPETIYIEPTDAEALASAIRILQYDEQKRAEMILNGRIFAEKFMPALLSRQLIKAYTRAD